MNCEWTVADEPRCPFPAIFKVYDLMLCAIHARQAVAIHDTVVAEKQGREVAAMPGPRRRMAKGHASNSRDKAPV